MGSSPTAGTFRFSFRLLNPEVFYLFIQGEQRGPYTIPQIDHLLNSGLINEDAFYWREGLEEPQPVTNLVSLRKKAHRSWIKPAIALGVVLVVGLLLARLLGPAVVDGWREAAQYEYTDKAAYWRARDAVRQQVNAARGLVIFEPRAAAEVALHPPEAAVVVLEGDLTENKATRKAQWKVNLQFDPKAKEWKASAINEVSS